MSSGLYPDVFVIERYLASVSASTLGQVAVAPCDLEVLGMLLVLGTACGGSDGLTVNISNSPTSQISEVSAYNLWTATNVPTISGTATKSFTAGLITTNAYLGVLIDNMPYAIDYPFPGPPGTVGYETAQSTSLTTSNPVVTPPTIDKFGILTGLVPPDNTYTDLNGVTGVSAAIVHEGDILSFVIAAITSVGSAANLSMSLFVQKK